MTLNPPTIHECSHWCLHPTSPCLGVGRRGMQILLLQLPYLGTTFEVRLQCKPRLCTVWIRYTHILHLLLPSVIRILLPYFSLINFRGLPGSLTSTLRSTTLWNIGTLAFYKVFHSYQKLAKWPTHSLNAQRATGYELKWLDCDFCKKEGVDTRVRPIVKTLNDNAMARKEGAWNKGQCSKALNHIRFESYYWWSLERGLQKEVFRNCNLCNSLPWLY